MNYTNFSKVVNTAEFKDACDLSLAKTATFIKGEAPNANQSINTKRWAFADHILAGVTNNAYYRVIAVTIASPDTELAPFLTTPVGAMTGGFDAALDNAVSAVWNDLAGINTND
jgi:hypothetical protein